MSASWATSTSWRQCSHSTACSAPSAVSTPTTMITYSFRNSRRPCQGLGLWMSMALLLGGEGMADAGGRDPSLARSHRWCHHEGAHVLGDGGRRRRGLRAKARTRLAVEVDAVLVGGGDLAAADQARLGDAGLNRSG